MPTVILRTALTVGALAACDPQRKAVASAAFGEAGEGGKDPIEGRDDEFECSAA